MIDDNNNKKKTIDNDLQWSTIINLNCWWSMMINEKTMVIDDDWYDKQLSNLINNDQQWQI